MRYQYVVILKKDSARVTYALSILVLFISVIGFSISGLKAFHTDHFPGTVGAGSATTAPASAWLTLGAAVALLAGLVIQLVTLRRRGTRKDRFHYWLFGAGVVWVGLTSVPWIAALFFLLAFLEYQTKRPLEIGFDHDHVAINSLIPRRFEWTAFNNVILRDGLLTLDFKTNRLMQKEVADDDEEDDADEEEFNAFCRDRLAAADKRAHHVH